MNVPALWPPGKEIRPTRATPITGTWREWYWLVVPLLAILAYFSVLQVGFLSDDFVLLGQAQASGVDPSVFIPAPHWFLYRPLGTLLVWQLGWQLWGFNPLAFHAQSLLLHAGASLLLGLWLSTATGRRGLGWLAGALFAVFPLNLEAVAWVAAQWDALAVFLGLFGLWLFAVWWREPSTPRPYLLALSAFAYGAAIFAKESMLAFLPMFAVSAWLATPHVERRTLTRLALSMLPFASLLGLNVGLRLVYWGHLGGYARTQIDYESLFPVAWDQLIAYAKLLLAPINSALLGPAPVQLVGLITSSLLLLGLILYGSQQWRALLAAGVWLGLALAPVLVLPLSSADLQNNRFLYLAVAGYCVLLAVLICAVLSHLRQGPRWAPVVVSILLAAGAALCWVQLGPWRIASQQVSTIEAELGALLPPVRDDNSATWYVQNLPDNYRGAYVFRLGLGVARQLEHGGGVPAVLAVDDAAAAQLASETHDVFALRFAWDETDTAFHTVYGGGISMPASAPTANDEGALVWDFTKCGPAVIAGWTVNNALVSCLEGRGLALTPGTNDPQMLLANLPWPAAPDSQARIRLRAELRLPLASGTARYATQWYWNGDAKHFNEQHSFVVPLRPSNVWYDYWAFASTTEPGKPISAVRFDPINAKVPLEIRWIAMDVVK